MWRRCTNTAVVDACVVVIVVVAAAVTLCRSGNQSLFYPSKIGFPGFHRRRRSCNSHGRSLLFLVFNDERMIFHFARTFEFDAVIIPHDRSTPKYKSSSLLLPRALKVAGTNTRKNKNPVSNSLFLSPSNEAMLRED